jgi:hypothetical protein
VVKFRSTRPIWADLALERLRTAVERLRLAAGAGELGFTLSAGIVQHRRGEAVADTIAQGRLAVLR